MATSRYRSNMHIYGLAIFMNTVRLQICFSFCARCISFFLTSVVDYFIFLTTIQLPCLLWSFLAKKRTIQVTSQN
ncbi:unnamed protein product [Rotaria magnacalcarata]